MAVNKTRMRMPQEPGLKSFPRFLAQYPQHSEETEERAAIMQYHGGASRKTAEGMAMLRIRDKYNLWGKH